MAGGTAWPVLREPVQARCFLRNFVIFEYVSIVILVLLIILWATPSASRPRPLLISPGLQILGIIASGSWHFWYANQSLGVLGGLTLASWGRWNDLGTFGSTTKDILTSRLQFLLIFDRFRGPF